MLAQWVNNNQEREEEEYSMTAEGQRSKIYPATCNMYSCFAALTKTGRVIKRNEKLLLFTSTSRGRILGRKTFFFSPTILLLSGEVLVGWHVGATTTLLWDPSWGLKILFACKYIR